MRAEGMAGIAQRQSRMGPRPLPLYLGMEGWAFLGSLSASQFLRHGWLSSKPNGASPPPNPASPTPAAPQNPVSPATESPPLGFNPALPEGVKAALADLFKQAGVAPDDGAFLAALAEAVDVEARRRFALFLEGVSRYRSHSTYRRLQDPLPCWQRGGVALRFYGEAKGGRTGQVPVVAIPSLINRAYVLDLNGRRSLMRHMARHGLSPYLVDWGSPGIEELDFDLTAYLDQRLIPALEAVVAREGRPPVVIGYCMGGLLALAASLRRPDLVSGFVGLATPWDFHADESAQMTVLRQALPEMLQVVDHMGLLPVDMLQAMFSGLDPRSISRKFQGFATLNPDSDKAKVFVGLEDWVNDGIPLVGPVARECLGGWYGNNAPARGLWEVGGKTVDPHALRVPSLFIVPERDRIVPPESARALAVKVPGATILHVPLGHIGMIAGSGALRHVYSPLTRWIKRNFATQ
jgi:polyhydroxyalkanoate synthase